MGLLWPIHQNQMRNVSFSYKQTSLYVFDIQEYIHMEYKLYNNRAATLIRLVVEFILRSTILYVCLYVFHCFRSEILPSQKSYHLKEYKFTLDTKELSILKVSYPRHVKINPNFKVDFSLSKLLYWNSLISKST